MAPPNRRCSARSTGSARRRCRRAATSRIATRPASRRWSAAGCSTSTASRSPARCSTSGRPKANGLYDLQDQNLDGLHMRGKFRTDAEGRYLVRTVQPVNYPIPADGPVGAMLKATGRHPWRPAHIHFVVSADGYEPVTTHIFDRTDPVSGERRGVRGQGFAGLRFRPARGARAPRRAGSASRRPFCTAEFDFRLAPASAPQATAMDAQRRLAALGAPRLRQSRRMPARAGAVDRTARAPMIGTRSRRQNDHGRPLRHLMGRGVWAQRADRPRPPRSRTGHRRIGKPNCGSSAAT